MSTSSSNNSAHSSAPASDAADVPIESALERVRKKLLDLSRRNRLLNFRDGARTIRVVEELPDAVFDLIVNQERKMEFACADESILQRYLPPAEIPPNDTTARSKAGGAYELPNVLEANGEFLDGYLQTPFDEKKLEVRLKRVQGEHQRIIEETGTSTLYMAIGFLEWFESDDSEVPNIAPLILVPVNIERVRASSAKSSHIKYTLAYDGQDLQFNISLSELLKRDFDLLLPELPSDEEVIVPENYFGAVADAVKTKRKWKIRREIAVDFFSFAKLFMFLDLDAKRWPQGARITEHKLIRQILGLESIGESTVLDDEPDLDRDPNFNRIPLVLDADSSQHKVIAHALDGRTLVVEGPPGTGKSQTITNLIATLLERGKRVLFVAEKLAALQVVKRRIDSVGLGPYILELHSHKVNKQQVLANIRERVDHWPAKPKGLEELRQDLERARERLNSYVRLINVEFNGTGFRIFEILWKYDGLLSKHGGLSPIAIADADKISKKSVRAIEDGLLDLQRLLEASTDTLTAWRGIDLENLNPANIDEFRDLLADFESTLDELGNITDALGRLTGFISDANFSKIRHSAKTALEASLLPPSNFVQELASACGTRVEVERFHSHINHIRLLEQLGPQVNQQLPVASVVSDDVFRSLHSSFQVLIEAGLGDRNLDELEQLRDASHSLAEAITDFYVEIVPLIKNLGCREPRSHDDLIELSLFLDVASRKINPSFVDLVTPLTLDASFDAFCENAESRAGDLVRLAGQYQPILLSDECPTIDDVRSVAAVVRSHKGRWFKLFSGELRRTRVQAGVWLKKVPVDLIELEEQLESLQDCLTELGQFRASPSHKERLGVKFRGATSEWREIRAFRLWNSDVRRLIPNNEVLRRLGGSFSEFFQNSGRLIGAIELFLKNFSEYRADIRRLTAALSPNRHILNDFDSKSSFLGIADRARKTVVFLDNHLSGMNEQLSSSRRTLQTYSEAFEQERLRREVSAIIFQEEEWVRSKLGSGYLGFAEDSIAHEKTVDWCLRVYECLPPDHASWILADDSLRRHSQLLEIYRTVANLSDKIGHLEGGLARFGGENRPTPRLSQDDGKSLRELHRLATHYLASLGSALLWGDVCRSLARLRNQGLDGLTSLVESGDVPPAKIRELYLFSLYRAQAQAVFRAYPILGSFSRQEHEGLRERFKALDRKVQELLALEISYSLVNKRIPEGRAHGRVKEYSEMALIRHELQKKKRHIPVRQLVRRAGGALQAMKPCFMMSPLSVAQFIPPEGLKFDVVVMDEASQLRPEDCLGAIARGAQLIVVGDSNQLPPTQFFDRICDDGDERDDQVSIDDMESVLDVCAKIYHPTQRLLWHYRSEHEDLIRFSNFHFYNQSLMLFPSPCPKSLDYGVFHQFVEGGFFAGGRNLKEAAAVAHAVLNHLAEKPNESLGVGTFNREQRELIDDQIELLLRERPELVTLYENAKEGVEPFFIKNIENIQGDERDVIFISCTYGPDKETGKVYQRFGPINSAMGWRRLNVIFTRAKKRLKLFTSMRSDDVIAGEQSSRGVQMLKHYLKFAEDRQIVDFGEVTGRGADSDFEISVGEVVLQLGYEFEANLGVAGFFIDLAVRHPNRKDVFMLGIECDGAAYHSARSARDRDRLREEILARKGWELHRIWSTDWFKNRKVEIDRLAKKLSDTAASSFQ